MDSCLVMVGSDGASMTIDYNNSTAANKIISLCIIFLEGELWLLYWEVRWKLWLLGSRCRRFSTSKLKEVAMGKFVPLSFKFSHSI
jgi:hypothetical protein